MNRVFMAIAVFICISVDAQLENGFKMQEARDMLAICNSFTFIDLYNTDEDILPPQYVKIYTSGVFGMDNKYQVYRKENVAVINLRGSTDKKISWMENIYSAMIPAKGKIKASGEIFNYCFARDTGATVHSGYALGLAYLANDVLYHIKSLNREGIYDFIITGHSQGGSLANMLRAYLENLPGDEISKENNFKTYAFAAPMVGNKAFAEEYNARFCSNYSSFNIVNVADPVPGFPVSYPEENFISESLKSMLEEEGTFSPKKMVTDGLIYLFQDNISKSVKKLGYSTSAQISKELGPVEMPQFVQGFNYQKLGNVIELKPVEYPKMLKDSTILQNDSLMAIYKRDENGNFLNKILYVKEPWAYQHKPYNYYVSFLKQYFPGQYFILERKYLPENL
jgi:hypothetical protein